MKISTRQLVYTALLLALCVLFQSLRLLFPALAGLKIFGPFDLSVLLIGTLVNLTLILATWLVGFWSGAAIALLAPAIAFLQGFQTIPAMVAAIILGNLGLVVFCHLLREKPVLGVAAGAVVKFAAQYALVALLVVPIFVSDPKQVKALPILFSWPQLVTACLGGLLALLIVPRLKRALRTQ